MIALAALLASLALVLPFPPEWIDTVQVKVNVRQEHPGWLGYACGACPGPVLSLEPLIGTFANSDILLRNVVAHESYHLYFGSSHGTPADPWDERGAYAFACVVQYVPMCDGWLSFSRPAP